MLSGSSLSCRSPPCSHTAISSTSLTVLLQASDLVRYTLSPADLNPSPPRFDLRAVRCHLLVLPFLQNFHQLTVAHSACMCHNLFAVMYFSHIYFTTNKKPRRPFWATLTSCFSGLFCYSPVFIVSSSGSGAGRGSARRGRQTPPRSRRVPASPGRCPAVRRSPPGRRPSSRWRESGGRRWSCC